MTDEEKATQIGQSWYYTGTNSNDAAYRASLQMAMWKDKQFQEFLDSIGLVVKEMYDQYKNTKRKDLHKIANTANVNYILKREPNLTKTLENITDTVIGYFKRGDNITFETYGCEITFKFK